MSDPGSVCPAIDDVVSVLTPGADAQLLDHVEQCAACQGVLALVGDRDGMRDDAALGCAEAELWLAERAAGTLGVRDSQTLASHLTECAACSEIAD